MTEKMLKLTPIDDNVIVRVIPQEAKIGSIILPGETVEASTLCEVIVPNECSYNRDGTKRNPFLETGMTVRIPKGNVGTQMPEAPEGETWLCIPEDCIYYIVG